MRRDERGVSGSVQVTLLLPLAVGVFLLALQWSMLAWANTTVHAAAQDGAAAAAAFGSDESIGRAVALAATDHAAVTGATAEVVRGANMTTATVRGTALAVVPFFPTSVEGSATVPTERLTKP